MEVSGAFQLRFSICIMVGVMLLAHSSYANHDCEHVMRELEPCYAYMRSVGTPSRKCCEELREEVKHVDNQMEYLEFYCCVKRICEFLYSPYPVPRPHPARRLETLLQQCGIVPPARIPGPPYPNC